MAREGRVADTGDTAIIFISGDKQALWVRVGSEVALQYQSSYLNSALSDPVTFSHGVWAQFVDTVNSRLAKPVERRKRRVARTFTVHRLRNSARTGIPGRRPMG